MKALLLTLLILGGLGASAGLAAERIEKLDTGIANVYLIRGERPVLVDASSQDQAPKIEAWLTTLGVAPAELGLIVLTHAHSDHAGGAGYFARKYQVPVLVGAGDLGMLRQGRAEVLNPTSVFAGLLRIFVNQPYQPFEATQVAQAEISLADYGIPGRIIPLPGGHTAGSLAVILDDSHEALVGDLVRGSITQPGVAEEHFYHENRQLSRWQLWWLIRHQGVETLHPGHFGSFTADEVRLRFFPDGRFVWP